MILTAISLQQDVHFSLNVYSAFQYQVLQCISAKKIEAYLRHMALVLVECDLFYFISFQFILYFYEGGKLDT